MSVLSEQSGMHPAEDVDDHDEDEEDDGDDGEEQEEEEEEEAATEDEYFESELLDFEAQLRELRKRIETQQKIGEEPSTILSAITVRFNKQEMEMPLDQYSRVFECMTQLSDCLISESSQFSEWSSMKALFTAAKAYRNRYPAPPAHSEMSELLDAAKEFTSRSNPHSSHSHSRRNSSLSRRISLSPRRSSVVDRSSDATSRGSKSSRRARSHSRSRSRSSRRRRSSRSSRSRGSGGHHSSSSSDAAYRPTLRHRHSSSSSSNEVYDHSYEESRHRRSTIVTTLSSSSSVSSAGGPPSSSSASTPASVAHLSGPLSHPASFPARAGPAYHQHYPPPPAHHHNHHHHQQPHPHHAGPPPGYGGMISPSSIHNGAGPPSSSVSWAPSLSPPVSSAAHPNSHHHHHSHSHPPHPSSAMHRGHHLDSAHSHPSMALDHHHRRGSDHRAGAHGSSIASMNHDSTVSVSGGGGSSVSGSGRVASEGVSSGMTGSSSSSSSTTTTTSMMNSSDLDFYGLPPPRRSIRNVNRDLQWFDKRDSFTRQIDDNFDAMPRLTAIDKRSGLDLCLGFNEGRCRGDCKWAHYCWSCKSGAHSAMHCPLHPRRIFDAPSLHDFKVAALSKPRGFLENGHHRRHRMNVDNDHDEDDDGDNGDDDHIHHRSAKQAHHHSGCLDLSVNDHHGSSQTPTPCVNWNLYGCNAGHLCVLSHVCMHCYEAHPMRHSKVCLYRYRESLDASKFSEVFDLEFSADKFLDRQLLFPVGFLEFGDPCSRGSSAPSSTSIVVNALRQVNGRRLDSHPVSRGLYRNIGLFRDFYPKFRSDSSHSHSCSSSSVTPSSMCANRDRGSTMGPDSLARMPSDYHSCDGPYPRRSRSPDATASTTSRMSNNNHHSNHHLSPSMCRGRESSHSPPAHHHHHHHHRYDRDHPSRLDRDYHASANGSGSLSNGGARSLAISRHHSAEDDCGRMSMVSQHHHNHHHRDSVGDYTVTVSATLSEVCALYNTVQGCPMSKGSPLSSLAQCEDEDDHHHHSANHRGSSLVRSMSNNSNRHGSSSNDPSNGSVSLLSEEDDTCILHHVCLVCFGPHRWMDCQLYRNSLIIFSVGDVVICESAARESEEHRPMDECFYSSARKQRIFIVAEIDDRSLLESGTPTSETAAAAVGGGDAGDVGRNGSGKSVKPTVICEDIMKQRLSTLDLSELRKIPTGMKIRVRKANKSNNSDEDRKQEEQESIKSPVLRKEDGWRIGRSAVDYCVYCQICDVGFVDLRAAQQHCDESLKHRDLIDRSSDAPNLPAEWSSMNKEDDSSAADPTTMSVMKKPRSEWCAVCNVSGNITEHLQSTRHKSANTWAMLSVARSTVDEQGRLVCLVCSDAMFAQSEDYFTHCREHQSSLQQAIEPCPRFNSKVCNDSKCLFQHTCVDCGSNEPRSKCKTCRGKEICLGFNRGVTGCMYSSVRCHRRHVCLECRGPHPKAGCPKLGLDHRLFDTFGRPLIDRSDRSHHHHSSAAGGGSHWKGHHHHSSVSSSSGGGSGAGGRGRGSSPAMVYDRPPPSMSRDF